MDRLFGKRKTPEELLRQNQRALNKVIRELDRERSALERQEKKLIGDIKKMAKTGQMEAVKIMAKDLVRTRAFVKKFILMRANIQAVALKVQTLRSQAAMANAMKAIIPKQAKVVLQNKKAILTRHNVTRVCIHGNGSLVWWITGGDHEVFDVKIHPWFPPEGGVSKALHRLNNKIKLPQMQKIMMEFERESEIMDLKEEMMSDTIDDVIGEEDDEEETEAIVGQVLDELGISLDMELSSITPGLDRPKIQEGQKSKQVVAAGMDTDDLQSRLDSLKRDDDD